MKSDIACFAFQLVAFDASTRVHRQLGQRLMPRAEPSEEIHPMPTTSVPPLTELPKHIVSDIATRSELTKLVDNGTNNNYAEWVIKSYHQLVYGPGNPRFFFRTLIHTHQNPYLC